jgi:hypothetical protein
MARRMQRSKVGYLMVAMDTIKLIKERMVDGEGPGYDITQRTPFPQESTSSS